MKNNIHIITLAGDIASGKGTISNIMKLKLNYEIYRNGEYFRSLAKEHNMSVKDFNIYVESHSEIDFEIEKSAEKYARDHDNLIIDARLGWYAVPYSFKVYLKTDLKEAARRLYLDDIRDKSVELYSSVEEAEREIAERFKLENDRYLSIYGVKKDDMSNYDYVLDTTNILPEVAADKIITEYFNWLKKQEN
ncbi:MAG: cytidylate kinase family protein [Clostridia bacterium]